MKKRKNSNGIGLYVAISLVAIALFVTTVGVSAGVSFQQLLANAIADRVSGDVVNGLNFDTSEVELGAAAGTDYYNPVQFHEGVYPTVHVDASFPATSTKNIVGGEAQDDIAFFYASRDLVCDKVWLDITSAVGTGGPAYSFSVGTTTKTGESWVSTSTATLIASTTVATTATSDNKGIFAFSNQTAPGTYYTGQTGNASSSLFVLNAGEYLVANYKTHSATSSGSWTYSNARAVLNANCWTR